MGRLLHTLYRKRTYSRRAKKFFWLEVETDKDKRHVFEQYIHTRLSAQTNTDFTSKNKLKKDASLFNPFEELCIQSIENIISESERDVLVRLIQNDIDNRIVFEQYSNTKLKPDTTLVYPYKQQLKKTPTNKTLWLYWTSAVAASIVMFFLWFTQKHETKYSLQAVNNKYRQIYSKKPVIEQKEQPSNYKTTNQHFMQKTTDAMPNDVIAPQQHIAQITITDTTSDKLIAEKAIAAIIYDTVQYNDKVIKESLDKLFANHRYHYFHDMIDQTIDANQQGAPETQFFSLWKLLQKGSKYLNYTGANVKVNKYDQPNSVKKRNSYR